MITAMLTTIDAGYDSEKDQIVKLGWVIGDEFEVESINMGGSSTTIKLKYYGYFNSVFFEFYEDGNPLDIYSDKRFNPYMR